MAKAVIRKSITTFAKLPMLMVATASAETSPTEVQHVERDYPLGKIEPAGELADGRRDDCL